MDLQDVLLQILERQKEINEQLSKMEERLDKIEKQRVRIERWIWIAIIILLLPIIIGIFNLITE